MEKQTKPLISCISGRGEGAKNCDNFGDVIHVVPDFLDRCLKGALAVLVLIVFVWNQRVLSPQPKPTRKRL